MVGRSLGRFPIHIRIGYGDCDKSGRTGCHQRVRRILNDGHLGRLQSQFTGRQQKDIGMALAPSGLCTGVDAVKAVHDTQTRKGRVAVAAFAGRCQRHLDALRLQSAQCLDSTRLGLDLGRIGIDEEIADRLIDGFGGHIGKVPFCQIPSALIDGSGSQFFIQSLFGLDAMGTEKGRAAGPPVRHGIEQRTVHIKNHTFDQSFLTSLAI